MGNEQSVRETHFNRSDATDPLEDESSEQHISISNKMVERLVEDASLVAELSTTSNTKEDQKEKMFMEKLRHLDDVHSARSGLTAGDINAQLARVEMRTANMGYSEPVCAGVKDEIIKCYELSQPDDVIKCWNTIGDFSKCVQEASKNRLETRNERDALETERRSRHVARAREHALREFSG